MDACVPDLLETLSAYGVVFFVYDYLHESEEYQFEREVLVRQMACEGTSACRLTPMTIQTPTSRTTHW
eukprot:4606011-Karenia_brevis.AAC.1